MHQIQKQLAALCIYVLLSSTSFGQIVYTDIPDATPNATYVLDLNNDMIDDFVIQFQSIQHILCTPQNENAYAGNIIGDTYSPYALTASTLICDSLIAWYGANQPGTMVSGNELGYWLNATDLYLALKLQVDAETYYGWARLDVDASSSSFTIKDYAYNSNPSECIEAGQTFVGIAEIESTPIYHLAPNPMTSIAYLSTSNYFHDVTLTIFNTYGHVIKQLHHIHGRSLEIRSEDWVTGVYILHLAQDNSTLISMKFIVANDPK
jgi:hypothetical protein